MIGNLQDLDMVLFDFDDTLCIHAEHGGSEELDQEWMVKVLRKGAAAWEKCSINESMKLFMEECLNCNLQMGLISTVESEKHAKGKFDWVIKNYGIILENFCVSTFEGKLDMMLAISKAYGIPKEKILIVDDYWKNLERAANAGFKACTPMEVVNWVKENSSDNR